MNTCDEYREAVGADPSFDGGAGHLSTCEACQAFRAEMQDLDQLIGRAMRLSVPELALPDLAEIDTSNVAVMPRRRFGAPAWLALAATVTLAAFLGFRMFGNDLSAVPLAEQIVAHIEHEPYAVRVTDEAVSDRRLARVVPASVATMDHSAGLITYAQSCLINGHEVPHLVIQGERGPITILLMPEEAVAGAQSIVSERLNGVILPVGRGSIAIIGEEGENLQKIEEQVLSSVTWST
jgi:hypothetical protein